MLKFVTHDAQIRLTPVIRPYSRLSTDAYEIPARIREQVALRDSFEVFPGTSRVSRRQQFDHTDPFRPGRKCQTRASNLGPLSTKVHRAKTHGRWHVEQPRPGVFLWVSADGVRCRVSPLGTYQFDKDPRYRELDELLWQYERQRA